MSIPMDSPVDRISGPSIGSTSRNLSKEKTASLTAYKSETQGVMLIFLSLFPMMICVATLARGIPVALERKGTVREARGLTSRM